MIKSIIKYSFIITITALVSIWFSAFWLWPPVKPETRVPTVAELQMRINNALMSDEKIKVDNKFGQETKYNWELALSRQSGRDLVIRQERAMVRSK